jgi:UDPglucose 6-dehydrogenase
VSTLSFFHTVAREVAPVLRYAVVVIKSTVPVGNGDEVDAIIRKQRPDADFSVASNPDFRGEGSATEDCRHPYRIVVGTVDERAREVILADYRTHFLRRAPMRFTERRSLELIK